MEVARHRPFRTSLQGRGGGPAWFFKAVFRVIASDGFRTGIDQSSGTFTVPDNAPVLALESPFEGETFTEREPVLLRAVGLDQEDGRLKDASFNWTSDRDGALGRGRPELSGSRLSDGHHSITVTATDSGGHRVAATVHILVHRDRAAFPLLLLLAGGALAFALLLALALARRSQRDGGRVS